MFYAYSQIRVMCIRLYCVHSNALYVFIVFIVFIVCNNNNIALYKRLDISEGVRG